MLLNRGYEIMLLMDFAYNGTHNIYKSIYITLHYIPSTSLQVL
jgi:hypothetical protein